MFKGKMHPGKESPNAVKFKKSDYLKNRFSVRDYIWKEEN